MQREIDDRLARAILSGEAHDGDAVKVDVASDGSALTLEALHASQGGFSGDPDDVIEAELLDD
jgi:ATP-dependent Clp protease ATP-binding subunit ClpB